MMNDTRERLDDIAGEIHMISACLVLLSNVASKDYSEGVGTPAPDVLQDAIYSVSLHANRVAVDVDKITAQILINEYEKRKNKTEARHDG